MQATSVAIGSVELLIVVLFLARPLSPRATALVAALAVGTFLTTLSFLLTTPHTKASRSSATRAPFLMKDLGLLGASVGVLGEAPTDISNRR